MADKKRKRTNEKDLDMAGVSIQWLKADFMKEVEASGFDASATVYDIEPTIIRGKGRDVACPIDGRIGASYAHALLATGHENCVGSATFMLSYGWGYKVKDIVDTLVDHCAFNNLNPENTFVWMCCLCNNQHRVAENKELGKAIPFEEFRGIFYRHVTGIKNILALMAPWHKPLYLTRIWCIFELYTSHHQEDCKLSIIMPPAEKRALKADLFGAQGKGINALYGALASTKIQEAKASMDSDRLAILQLIKDSGGTYDALNHSVNALLRAWVVQVIKSLVEEWNNKCSKQSTEASRTFYNIGCLLHDIGEFDDAMVEHKKP